MVLKTGLSLVLCLLPQAIQAQQGAGVGPPGGGPIMDGNIPFPQLQGELRRRPGQGGGLLPVRRGCTVYEHSGYRGAYRRFVPIEKVWNPVRQRNDLELRVNYLGDEWNDRISSLRCDVGCSAVFGANRDFEFVSFGGMRDIPDLDEWNDKASAIAVSCRV